MTILMSYHVTSSDRLQTVLIQLYQKLDNYIKQVKLITRNMGNRDNGLQYDSMLFKLITSDRICMSKHERSKAAWKQHQSWSQIFCKLTRVHIIHILLPLSCIIPYGLYQFIWLSRRFRQRLYSHWFFPGVRLSAKSLPPYPWKIGRSSKQKLKNRYHTPNVKASRVFIGKG